MMLIVDVGVCGERETLGRGLGSLAASEIPKDDVRVVQTLMRCNHSETQAAAAYAQER